MLTYIRSTLDKYPIRQVLFFFRISQCLPACHWWLCLHVEWIITILVTVCLSLTWLNARNPLYNHGCSDPMMTYICLSTYSNYCVLRECLQCRGRGRMYPLDSTTRRTQSWFYIDGSVCFNSVLVPTPPIHPTVRGSLILLRTWNALNYTRFQEKIHCINIHRKIHIHLKLSEIII